MQDKIALSEGINVFIEFQIVRDSQLSSLLEELDVLIAAGKKIHLWSKTVAPHEMEKYCKSIKVPTPKEEKELHRTIWLLRHKERKTLGDISTITGVTIPRVSYYSRMDPTREWVLADWIFSYEKKDSSIYPKVDFLVDPDPVLVDKFKRSGRVANLITKV